MCGRLLVTHVELKEHVLQIQARRLYLIFDDKTNSFRDGLHYLEEASKVPQRAKRKKKDRDRQGQEAPQWSDLKTYYLHQNVEIDIACVGDNPGAQEVSSALTSVFVKPGESQSDFVPDFWRNYFNRVEGRPPSVPHSTETVYRVTPGRVSPPRVTLTPEPEFSEWARMVKFQGIVTLALVVDASGRPTDIQIQSPLGFGLDEKAVEAVSKWKFEPAMKGGKPVPVRIAVEVDFHLN